MIKTTHPLRLTQAAVLSPLAGILLFLAIASAQAPRAIPKAAVTRASGGSVQTDLGYGIVLNKESSLEREWITVHDPSSPLVLPESLGVKTVYVRERSVGNYNYSVKFAAGAAEPLSAFEVRFLLFDLWGNHIKTLAITEVLDFEGPKEFSGSWTAYSENEVSKYYASIAFVARVRTKAGKVFEANLAPVLEEARKFSRKFSPENLESNTQKP